jgi:peptidyl-prolyl cis-trans isomerase B (cyclophilin B)
VALLSPEWRRLVWIGAACAAALGLAACGGDGDEDGAEDASTTPPAAGTGCRDVERPKPKPLRTLQPPSAILDRTKTYRVVVRTSCGDLTVTLDLEASPRAAASFVALAREGYFDDTFFHRIVPGFVVQGGDPSGTGGGGPGYTTVDTPARTTTYTNGVVAMAKAPAEARGTAGSQFFIVTAQNAGLPPDYAVIGKVTDGLDVLARISVLGDPNTEQPTQAVVIDEMKVEIS